ncbi:5070_t:CDS:2 [Paraglomus brasilianum]|uniref:5070_t:CDS:1 n=1 Tax=Paraglomus brasilianum TaxID=144538 RepID=A0A9N8ZVS9_9GLOM|nr:5070_t:CDS:2 [Paraglomus brasilianum]
MSTQRNSSDPLNPATILSIIEKSLPERASNDQDAPLKSCQDVLAILFHTIMLAVDFRFIGLGEDGTIASSTEEQDTIPRLPKEWNANGPDSYAFRYKHPQSSLMFLIKSIRLAGKFLVHGLAIEDNKTSTLEVVIADYTSASFFPYNGREPLVNGFISESRLKDLISLYKINILQKLIPGLNKPGYEETTQTTPPIRAQGTPQSRNDPYDPLRIPPRVPPTYPAPPVFDDPFSVEGPRTNPFSVGGDDLDPFGFSPLYPRFGVGGIPPPNRGGGMHVGLDHPMFGPRGGIRDDRGFRGGPPTLPRGAVPPGARFDPITPFNTNPRQNVGRNPTYFSGEPDNDEPPPPGYNDMFM